MVTTGVVVIGDSDSVVAEGSAAVVVTTDVSETACGADGRVVGSAATSTAVVGSGEEVVVATVVVGAGELVVVALTVLPAS